MIKKRRAVFICLSLSLTFMGTPFLSARLQEDEQALFRRYGTPIRNDSPVPPFVPTVYVFAKNGFEITAGLIEVGPTGHRTKECCFLHFKKLDHTPLSDAEISVLLDANAPAKDWKRTSQTSDEREWVNEGRATASYSSVTKTLILMRVDYVILLRFMRQKTEKQRLKDF